MAGKTLRKYTILYTGKNRGAKNIYDEARLCREKCGREVWANIKFFRYKKSVKALFFITTKSPEKQNCFPGLLIFVPAKGLSLLWRF